MTIVDSLKAKGSTGGNTIAEAIKNLPMGGSGGGGNEFVVNLFYDEAEHRNYLDKTFSEILDAINHGLNPVIYFNDTDNPDVYYDRYIYRLTYMEYDIEAADEINCMTFVNHYFYIEDNDSDGKLNFVVLRGNGLVRKGVATFLEVHVDD